MPIVQTESFATRSPRRPRIFAVFSYRYDAHLVPGLVENLRPAVDGFVSCDDRDGSLGLSDEPARRYSPAFIEDGGIWAPPIHLVGRPVDDPVPARLRLITQLLKSRGGAAASHVARDLATANTADTNLAVLASLLAVDGTEGTEGLTCPAPLDDTATGHYLAAHLSAANGDTDRAKRLMDKVRRKAPRGLWLAHDGVAPPDASGFSAPDAAWRDHLSGPARIHEGPRTASARMAVIVLSYRAPAHLHRAVASLLAQDRAAEIVVVNSGGGDAVGVLGHLMPRLRLVDVKERLYVGAARNVGIDASSAPYLAFLAADCVALPGWIAGREDRHLAGALSVSTPVVTLEPDNPVCLATSLYNYGRRNPAADAADISHFGRSYARTLFRKIGYFPPLLRESEDEVFNMAVDLIQMPVWAPNVLTGHEDPQTSGQAITDRMRRGYRMALGPNESVSGRADRRFRLLQVRQKARVSIADNLIARSPDLSDRDRNRLRRLVRILAVTEATTYRLGKLRVRLARLLSRVEQAVGGERLQLRLARLTVRLCAQNWRYHLRLGNLSAAAGDQEAARESLRRAAGLSPLSPEPVLALVDLQVAAGQPDAAQTAIERAILLAPGVPQLRLAGARVALSRGDGPLALLHAELAMAAGPSDPVIHDLLTEVHDVQGRPVLAKLRRAMAEELRRFDAALAPAQVPGS